MFSRLARLFKKPVPARDYLQQLVAAYDERGGEDDTLQGMLALAASALSSEANRNGLVNWGDNYEEYVDVLIKYLCDNTDTLSKNNHVEIRKDLEFIREAGRNGGSSAYEECDRMIEVVADWCKSYTKPILKPPGCDFW